MNAVLDSQLHGDANDEILTLIEQLGHIEQRLETLTAGQVDSVSDREGHTFLLRRAQERLRRSDAEKQAAILNVLPAHIALIDTRGKIVSINASWLNESTEHPLLGPGYEVGSNYLAACDTALVERAPHASRVAQGIRDVLMNGLKNFSVEYPAETPAGQRCYLLSVTPLADSPPTGAVVMHLDVTERTRSREALEQSAGLLQAVVSGTPDIIFVKDADGRYLLCNDALARFAGRRVEDMVGLDNEAIFGPVGVHELDQRDQLVMTTGKVMSGETLLVGTDGPRSYYTTKTPYRDASGAPIGVIGIARDISERKFAEQELRASQKLLSMAGRLAEVGAWSVDLPGFNVVWSDELATLHDEPIGFKPSVEEGLDYFVPEHRPLMKEAFEACVRLGQSFDVEHEILTARGRRIWVRVIGEAVLDGLGKVVRVQGALQDLSERKAIEQETQLLAQRLSDTNAKLEGRVLARTAELDSARIDAEQANRAKSAFLATMSHEIRTPMNGVIGMIDVLHRTGLSAPQVEMVDLIRDSADTLLKIIEDILDFSKIEAGKLVLESHSLRLIDLVEKVCGMLAPVALARNVIMSISVDKTLPLFVTGDELRLRQVLVNLVGNAIKFSGGRDRPGHVVVRASLFRREEIAVAGRPGKVVVDLSVSDDGIGIDKATLDRLFVPFSQADASTTRRFGGSGLGLAISSTLVRLMGGKMSVRSKPGSGSTFALRMSFAEPALTDIVHRSSGWGDTEPGGLDTTLSSRADAALPILVAEDNETNRKVIVLQLDLLGFRSVVVQDGLEALERWRSGSYSLLLTDLHMPKLDGYALAAAIRKEESDGERLPIVALTANALRDEELRCLAGGMDAYLSKPVRLPELKGVIESWIGPPRDLTSVDIDVADEGVPADLNVLRALIGNDPEVTLQVIEAFQSSASNSASIMMRAAEEGAAEPVQSAAHSLKAAARSIGAMRLGELCEELESAAIAADGDAIKALVSVFVHELDRVQAYLESQR